MRVGSEKDIKFLRSMAEEIEALQQKLKNHKFGDKDIQEFADESVTYLGEAIYYIPTLETEAERHERLADEAAEIAHQREVESRFMYR